MSPAVAKVDFSKNALTEDVMRTRWSALSPDMIAPAVDLGIDQAQANLERVRNQDPEEATFESTFMALEESTQLLDRVWARVAHWQRVDSSEGLSEAYNRANPRVMSFYAKVYTDAGLWQQLKAFADSVEPGELSPQQERAMNKTLHGFRAQGAELSAKDKATLLELQDQLTQLTQTYAQNALKDHEKWELYIEASRAELEANGGIPARLRGVPASILEACKAQALEKGRGTPEAPQWRLSLDQPIYTPIMLYAEEDSLRKTLWQGSQGVGRSPEHNNLKLVPEIVNLRQQKARLLGYKTYADWALAQRMAQTGQQALAFVEDLHKRTAPFFQANIKALEAFKAELQGSDTPLSLDPWEAGYLERLHTETYADFDPEALRPYFELSRVQNGLFEICSQVFGVQVKKLPTRCKKEGPRWGVDVWHPEVQAFELSDTKGNFIGIFYLDLFPRPGKRAGAWMDDLVWAGRDTSGKWQHPVGVICANMSPPSSKEAPILLSHDEVCTLFHEFGHLLHGMLGKEPIKSLNGTNVAWDFVEAPSQLLENFCWEKKSLKVFSKNYQTNEEIPCVLHEKLLKSRKVFQGLDLMRQLALSKMDLELHIHGSPPTEELDAYLDTLLKDYKPQYATPTLNLVCRFYHLFNSDSATETYAAGYYGYQWAEVLDADLFTRFKEADVLSSAVGQAFVEDVLAKGDSEAPAVLFERFMGRSQSFDAFLQRRGLQGKKTVETN